MADETAALLEDARRHYDVPRAETIDEVTALLRSWGATPADLDEHRDNLYDEFVDANLVVASFRFDAPTLLQERATPEERANFTEDPDETFDPDEYGPENAAWTTLAHELATLGTVVVIVESRADDVTRVGGFRVHGAGQWLRESLWAATGVLPRDPGPVDGALFARALASAGRAEQQADPL